MEQIQNKKPNKYINEKDEKAALLQKERGIRLRKIREDELKMRKAELGKAIGVSGQFIGLVETGRGNLMYKSVKRLMDLTGHSSDYILFGLDDSMIKQTRELLQDYTDEELIRTVETVKAIALIIKNKEVDY